MAIHLRAVARQGWNTLLRVTLLLVLAVVMMAALLVGTEGGRIGLMTQGVHMLRIWSGQDISVSGIRSPRLGQWRIGRIKVLGLAAAPSIQLSNLSLSWQWPYAVQNRWWFDQVSIDRVQVQFADSADGSNANPFANLYALWPKIPSIRIENVAIGDVSLDRPRYPTLHTALSAEGELNWGALPARFLVSLTEAGTGNSYAAELSADAIDRFRLQGSLLAHPLTAWARWLRWSLSEPAQATWNARIDYSDPGTLHVDIDQWSLPWQSHQLEAVGALDYQVAQGRLTFLPVDFTLDEKPASLSGWIEQNDSELAIEMTDWALEPFSDFAGVADLSGELSLQAQWFGGWRRPRLDANLRAQGAWREAPFDLLMTSSAERSRLRIETAQLKLGTNQVSAAGLVDWTTDTLDLTYQGQLYSDPLFQDLLPESLAQLNLGALVDGTLSGEFTDPTVGLDAQLQGSWQDDPVRATLSGTWGQGELKLSKFYVHTDLLQTSGSLNYALAEHSWQAQLNLTEWRAELLTRLGIEFPVEFRGAAYGDLAVSGQGREVDISGDVIVQGWWQDWPLNAQLAITSLQSSQLEFAASQLRLGSGLLQGSGIIDWRAKSLDLNLTHQDWPLATLPPWLSFWPRILDTFEGALTGQTLLTGLWKRPAIATDSIFHGSWFAQPLTLALVTRPDDNLHWQIDRFDAQWLAGDWHYSGDFWPYELRLAGDALLESIDGRQLPLLSREFIGAERALPEALDLRFDADIRLTGRLTAPVISGDLFGRGEFDGQPLVVHADVAHLDGDYVDIRAGQGQWAGGQWQVGGTYNWRVQQTALTLSTQTPDARPLVPWLKLALRDVVDLSALDTWQGSLDGQLQLDNRSQDWRIDGDLSSAGSLLDEPYQLRWQGQGRWQNQLQHEFVGQLGTSAVNASLVTEQQRVEGAISISELRFAQIQQLGAPVPEGLTGKLSAEMTLSGPLSLPELSAQVSSSGNLQSGDRAVPFTANMAFSGNRENWRVGQTLFEIPNGLALTVTGQGQELRGQLLFEGLLPDTAYWIDNAEVGPGVAKFSLQASGNLATPVLTGTLDWRSQNWPLMLQAQLRTDASRYLLTSSLYSDRQTRLKAELSTDILALAQWPAQLNEKAFEASLAINTPLSVLDPFFIDQPDQQLGGELAGALELRGSLLAPSWSGNLQWFDGFYEHAAYGTLVNGIRLNVTANNETWQIDGSATDGDRGQIQIQGDVQFQPAVQQRLAHQIDIGVTLVNAGLLNQAQRDATVSGALQATGSYHQLGVVGNLNVAPLNMQSDSFLWDGAPQLNIVQADGVIARSAQQPAYWPQGIWDVTVVANNRVNLYGQGINAELAGTVELTDDFYLPQIAGQFAIVRGTYFGFGKVFVLNEGTVQIQNNQLVLDVTGVYKDRDIEVGIRITGNQDALQLALSSPSGQGQDELLSQLLFGRRVEEMTVIQAVQLAAVINRLRTGDSGIDLIALTRDELTLDSLVVDTETSAAGNLTFNVSAGKYINKYLYLEVEQGVGTEQEFRSSLQYELTPRTYLELYTQGEFGSFNDNGVELNWSLDY
ncbi:translocation/assembly module TamB domain-containing protein [Reinekea sp.]|jgi:autotransporter translocation and assembly factor TamB|uniref:translocation/assembly module TamB domain-containing protein n=1 Tax=Reinekea sp. TaxID=1970455 RepID=UPI002A81DA6C|nr:translocation/assembly module TamB domain-containing protein [Reinekea sp.]